MSNEHEGKCYLITGGTGFLGWHLIELLLNRKCCIKVLARTKSKELNDLIKSMKSENPNSSVIEFIQASILDKTALINSMNGVNGVFHLAGAVVHSRLNSDPVFQINVTGTLNVIEAAAMHPGVKVVFASTSGTVSCSTDPHSMAYDSTPYCDKLISSWPYYKSKMEAEILATQYANEHNVTLVIIRPTMLFGPKDHYHRATKLIRDYMEGRIPFVPSGGLSFLDVRDAAVAFANAMGHRGQHGEKFLITSTNCSIDEFFNKLEVISGVPKPRLYLWPVLAILASRLLDFYNRKIIGKWKPDVDPVKAEMATYWWNTDSSRAEKVLDVSFRNHMQTLQETVDWIRSNESANS